MAGIVFISCAGEDEAFARSLALAVERDGFAVRSEADAHAVIVVWSEHAAASRQVRAEAEAARIAGRLVQVSSDEQLPPLPFRMLHCVSLRGWRGENDHPGWTKVKQSLARLRDGEPSAG